MVSGLNQQQNRNLQYGANNNAYNGSMNAAVNMAPVSAQTAQNGQNFGQLTVKPDTFENNSNDPNFGALSLEEEAQKVQEKLGDNPFFQMIKNMFGVDVDKPKKTLVSLGLTLTTVIGLAALGNSKISTEKLPDLGIKVSEALHNNSLYMGISKKLGNAKNSIVNFLKKSKTLNDVFETFVERPAKAVNQWAKGTGSGLKRIFSLTPPDTAKTALDKMVDAKDATKLESLKRAIVEGNKASEKLQMAGRKGKNISGDKLQSLNKLIAEGNAANTSLKALQETVDAPRIESIKKLVGDSKAKEVFEFVTKEGADSVEVSNKLLHSIGENFGVMKMVDGKAVVTDEKGLQTILRQLKAGKITGLDGTLNIDVSEFTNVKMNGNKGLMKIISDWWPVNIVDDIGRKIKGDKWKPFGRGNLGDALIKHSVISGQGTNTMAGKLVQQLALFPSEAISNFGNDKSGLGFFLCGMIMNLYNNVQDAPKEKKAATMADDFMGTIGSLAITTPLACATMYGLATLKNVKGTTAISKYLLKPVGKFFGAGLDQKWKKVIANPSGSKVKDFFRQVPGRTVGFAGGLMRLLLVMLVFQGMFGKPVKNVTNKIFGKPYDPLEEEQMKQMQAQAQQMENVMKNLNLTEEQMVAKLQANPEFVMALQNDAEALQAIQKDPTLLLQLIAALPDNGAAGLQNQNTGVQGSAGYSSLLNNYVNNNTVPQNMNAPQMQQNQAMPAYNQPQGMQPQQQYAQAPQGVQQNPQGLMQNNTVQNAPQSPTEPAEPKRTYIPSSKPFNYVEGDANTIKNEEITNANVQAMLSKADLAEQNAMKILG